MRKVYCYAEKQKKEKKKDNPDNMIPNEPRMELKDMKYLVVNGEVIENPDYEPTEYMKLFSARLKEKLKRFNASEEVNEIAEDKDVTESETEEIKSKNSDGEMPQWIADMPYGELLKKFPGGIEEALEFAKNQKETEEPKVHYNSPEPEKFGAKAFTKGDEIHIAPGEEDSLEHEIAHYYQQMEGKVKPTGEINGEKVNLDPKLEEEADKIAKNLCTVKNIKKGITQIQDVIQFDKPTADNVRRVAEEQEVPTYLITENNITDILEQLNDKSDDVDIKFAWDEIVDGIKSNIKEKATTNGIAENLLNEKVIEIIFHKILPYTSEPLDSEIEKYTAAIRKIDTFTQLRKMGNASPAKIISILEKWDGQLTTIETTVEQEFFNISDSTLAVTEFRDKKIFNGYSFKQLVQLLSVEQIQKINSCISILEKCCDSEGIESVIVSASKNLHYNLLDFSGRNSQQERKSLTNYFVKRLELIVIYIKDVYEKLGGSDGKYLIRSTGSDPHKDGQHALFLINRATKKKERLYKPDLDRRPEAEIVGQSEEPIQKGIFSQINDKIQEWGSPTELDGKSALATMEINPKNSTEEFIEKKDSMTSDEAKLYFYRAGILDAVTKAMAIIDLHYENVMPTEKGSLIIDGEAAFVQYVSTLFSDEHLGTSALGANLASFPQNQGVNVNSYFTITDDSEIKNSSQAFKKKDSQYHASFKLGYAYMVNLMYTKKEDFQTIYKSELQKVGKIRIVPMFTGDFAEALNTVMKTAILQEKKETIDKLAIEIKNGFNTRIRNEFLEVAFDDAKLNEAIQKTFEKGTIIAMFLDMTTGNILLDDDAVGNFVDAVSKSKLDKNGLVDAMTNKFLAKIEELSHPTIPVSKPVVEDDEYDFDFDDDAITELEIMPNVGQIQNMIDLSEFMENDSDDDF